MESITLYFREGSSDKVYQATIEPKDSGYVVHFAYGRRGSTLNTGTKTQSPVPYDQAKAIYDKLIKEKQAKGYTVGESGTPYQHTDKAERSTGILPQLLNPIEEADVEKYILNPAYVMQEKYDGKRMLLQKKGNEIIGINRQGLAIGIDPKVVAAAKLSPMDFLIDGEAVGDKLYVFDLLTIGERDMQNCSYLERLLRLINWRDTFRHAGITLVRTAYEPPDKRKLFENLKAQNKEGVVFKNVDAFYIAGRPASLGPQLKYKFYETASFVVQKVNTKRSVSLVLLKMGQPVSAGNVTIPANHEIPGEGAIVECRYLYAFKESGCIYQPTYLGARTDLTQEDCTVEQLKYKADT